MGTYKFLEHTADEKIAIEATTYADAFATAVEAMHEILLGDQKVNHIIQKEIILENKKITTLLYDFINEFIIFFDEEDLVLPHVEDIIIEFDGIYKLRAIVKGDKQQNYELRTEIKNMTYSDMKIEEKEGKIFAQIVLDI